MPSKLLSLGFELGNSGFGAFRADRSVLCSGFLCQQFLLLRLERHFHLSKLRPEHLQGIFQCLHSRCAQSISLCCDVCEPNKNPCWRAVG